jgi:hypothetical protein
LSSHPFSFASSVDIDLAWLRLCYLGLKQSMLDPLHISHTPLISLFLQPVDSLLRAGEMGIRFF